MISSFLLELRTDRRTGGFAAVFERDFTSRPECWVPAFLMEGGRGGRGGGAEGAECGDDA